MTDATQGDSASQLHRDFTFHGESLDFRTNRMFYYDLYTTHGEELNDGQVPVSRALFWPSLIQYLNPQQHRAQFTMLGVACVNHWAIAMDKVFDVEKNPFPRDVLLNSIGTFLHME